MFFCNLISKHIAKNIDYYRFVLIITADDPINKADVAYASTVQKKIRDYVLRKCTKGHVNLMEFLAFGSDFQYDYNPIIQSPETSISNFFDFLLFIWQKNYFATQSFDEFIRDMMTSGGVGIKMVTNADDPLLQPQYPKIVELCVVKVLEQQLNLSNGWDGIRKFALEFRSANDKTEKDVSEPTNDVESSNEEDVKE